MTFLQLAVIFILEQNVFLGMGFHEGFQTQFWSQFLDTHLVITGLAGHCYEYRAGSCLGEEVSSLPPECVPW